MPKTAKKITTKVLTDLGVFFDGNDYIVENRPLFEEKVWIFLTQQQKLDLLLDELSAMGIKLEDVARNQERIDRTLDNLTITVRPYYG